MNIELNVKADVKEVVRMLDSVQRKQVPFATSRALNDTAYDGMQHARKMAKRLLNRPTASTIRGIRYFKSTKKDLRAGVFIDDGYSHAIERVPGRGNIFSGRPVLNWMSPNITGGPRRDKGMENALRRVGVLPEGKYIVPMPGQRDANGNMKKGLTQQIMSQMGAFRELGSKANATAASLARKQSKYFLVPKVGIFTRYYGSAYPVILFVDKPNYKVRYPFAQIVDRRARRKFPVNFNRRLKQALETAK